jgi:glutaredoxin 3
MTQPTIIMYSSAHCPYCDRAKQLLDAKKITYTVHRIDLDPEKFAQMQKLCNNARTVPQILINNAPIGGFDDLKALDQSGQLDTLLNQTGE